MDLNDFPFLDDPARAIGWGSYRFTEDEFIAANRAVRMAMMPWYRSWPWAIAFFGAWHAALLIGLYLAFVAPRPEGEAFNVPGAILSVVSAFMLWMTLYGLGRRVRAAYRQSQAAGDEVGMAFTPDRYMIRMALGDTSDDWAFLCRVVEFRDGFAPVLKLGGAMWLPDHALAAPFDHRAAAELFRSKVPKYRVVDRSVRRGPVRGPVPDRV